MSELEALVGRNSLSEDQTSHDGNQAPFQESMNYVGSPSSNLLSLPGPDLSERSANQAQLSVVQRVKALFDDPYNAAEGASNAVVADRDEHPPTPQFIEPGVLNFHAHVAEVARPQSADESSSPGEDRSGDESDLPCTAAEAEEAEEAEVAEEARPREIPSIDLIPEDSSQTPNDEHDVDSNIPAPSARLPLRLRLWTVQSGTWGLVC